jgi:hypothetical protein
MDSEQQKWIVNNSCLFNKESLLFQCSKKTYQSPGNIEFILQISEYSKSQDKPCAFNSVFGK